MAHRSLSLPLMLTLAAAACAVEGEELQSFSAEEDLGDDLDAPLDEIELRDDGVVITDPVRVQTGELARIELSRGEVLFLVDEDGPEAGVITMVEQMRPDAEGTFMELRGDPSPLAAFLALTDEEVAVPEALLVGSDDEEALARAERRAITDRHTSPLHGIPSSIVAQADPQGWNTTTMCQQGQTSAMFAAEICPMTNWTYDYCHNGTWFSVTDDPGSLSPSHWTRSRTLACFWHGRVSHYYRFGGVWYEPLDNGVPSGELHTYTRTTINLLRRAINHRHDNGGWVRGASHFAEW